MFETLFAKTFLLLTLSLFTAYIGSLFAFKKMQQAIEEGRPEKIKGQMYAAIIANIIAFVLLMFLAGRTPLNMILMFVFTISSGFTLGVYTTQYGDVAQKAVALTAGTTLLTGLLASFSNIDFTGLGKILGIVLIIFVIISIIRIFVKIRGTGHKLLASVGVLLFTGYLLYDFSRLAKLKAVAAANNWETALNFAISIYLDIINLLMQLMQLLSSSSSN
jgi:FtsH-binding integral membrane protein